jgi:hypothetical protein
MENQELSKTIAKMAAEMSVFRQMIHGDLPTPHGACSKVVSPTLSADLIPSGEPVPNLKEELADLDFALPPPQSTVDPREASFSSPSASPKIDSTGLVPDSTQHPAVSVGKPLGSMEQLVRRILDGSGQTGLAEHLPHNVASPLSDNGFNRLFSPDPAIGGDFPLFEDGLSNLDGGHVVGGDPFTFDTLVDFDADQPLIELGEDHFNHVDKRFPPSNSTHLPDQLVATTACLQPSFGAPFEGRDGPGIAADV